MLPDNLTNTAPSEEDGIESYKSRKQFSISKSLTVGLTLVVLAVSVVAISLNFYFSAQKGIESLEKKADEYASFLSSSLKLSLWEYDTRSIHHIGSAFAQNEFIDVLEIYDADNEKVFSNKNSSASEVFLERSRDIYYGNQPAGRVYLSLTPVPYNKVNQQQLLSSVMTILFVLSALFIATGLLLRTFLRKPLNEMGQSLTAFAAGGHQAMKIDAPCVEFQGFVDILQDMQLKIEKHMAELQAAQQKYREIFENAAQGIFQINPEGVIISANPALADILGFDAPEDFIGWPQRDWQKGFIDHEFQAFIGKGAVEFDISGFETRIMRNDKNVIWVSISVKSIFDVSGRLKYNEGFILDITERKQREKAEKEREAARLALKAKSDFLANMSHEIRTPMNAIIGLTHLTLKTDLSAKQYDYLSKIRQSADALLRIINDILDFSKIEAGMLTMESISFNLESVMGNIINVISLAAEKKGLEFIFHIDSSVPLDLVGDPLRLEQVLINLSNNAVKFTEKGHVIIRVRLDDAPDKPEIDAATDSGHIRLLFSVEDTGVGLSDEQKTRLFQSFSQADSSVTRKYGGTGLGLAISKRLVELMNGTIRLDSEQGKGTIFYFDAVFGKKAGIEEKPFIPPNHLKGLKVLVVDDNSVARFVISDMLESFSFDVHQASSAREAFVELKTAAENRLPFKLVIMDWRMPEIDGVEAARRIKSDDGLLPVPAILMLTAYSRDDIQKKAEGAGVDGFLAKPVNMSLLFDIIIELLSKTTDSKAALLAAQQSDDIPGLDRIRGATILLVEDNEINRQVATELLESEGLKVRIAVNGQKALDVLSDPEFAETVDLVLMDIQMPEMDGITATRKIRHLDMPVSKIPILAMTAHALAYEREKCIEAGMNEHISKPIDPNRLFSALVEWIKPKTAVPVARPDRKIEDGALPDVLDGFDLDAGLSRVAGNRALLRDLLFKFAEKQPQVMEDIQSAILSREYAKAYEIAHKVKGMAGNIGATEVYPAASDLEAILKSRRETEIDDAVAQFSGVYQQAVDSVLSLKSVFPDSSHTTDAIAEHSSISSELPPAPLPEGIDTLVKEIADLIDSDYGAAIRAIETLREMVGSSELEKDALQLSQAVESFDDESTQNVLEKLAKKLNVKL